MNGYYLPLHDNVFIDVNYEFASRYDLITLANARYFICHLARIMSRSRNS